LIRFGEATNSGVASKTVKNRLSVEGSTLEPPLASDGSGIRPQTPALLLPLLLQLCQSLFLALKCVLLPSKKNNFCLFETFAPIFHFKLCRFAWQGAQEYFLPQGAGYPSYATGGEGLGKSD